MKKAKRFFGLPAIVLILLAAVFGAAAQQPIKDLRPTVILVSIDGFRPDYLEKYQPPTLNKLAREGTRAKFMTPSFPTKTFPNHYAIATGLYPENNGIVENNIYDFGTTFGMSKKEEVQNGRWWLGEPIWITAEKQGQHAAAMFFPGSEAEIKGFRPTFWKEYQHELPHEPRVDQVLSWLDLPREKRPTFLTLYFDDVDTQGHRHSPDSPETRDAVLKVDKAIARLMDGLKARKIDRKANVIIVSDHGMAALDQRNAVVFDEYVDLELAERILWTGEIVQIFPKEGRLEEMTDALRKVEHGWCLPKAEIPARLHYSTGSRVAPIVCSADEGWMYTSREYYERVKKHDDFGKITGAHGYDNKYESMHAVFIGHGKAFRKHKIVEGFPNVDVYELMCKILHLKPAPNDGNFERVRKMLR
jgi:predicted AlkP superfamily pyrophosphatase or phosphodiesterase